MNKKFALIGEHIAYSKSPLIHQAVYQQLRERCTANMDSPEEISATYELIEIPREDFETQFKGITKELDGMNVTIPYKERVIQLLDSVDEKALRIGAVNTVKKEGERWIGYNTDYDGFVSCLNYHRLHDLKRVVVLGTGGAAKMVTVALKDLKAEEIVVVSRTPEKAAHQFDGCQCLSYEDFIDEKASYSLMVNCTPMGQSVDVNDSWINASLIKQMAFVLDLNYTPSITPIMAMALDANIKCANGLMMLVMQAIKADRIWLSDALFEGSDDNKMTEEILTYL